MGRQVVNTVSLNSTVNVLRKLRENQNSAAGNTLK